MRKLADAFAVPAVDPDDPFIRRIGWKTRQERPFWSRTTLRPVVFFRERNPGYHDGHGLLTLVPLSLRNVLLAFLRHAVYTFRETGRGRYNRGIQA